MKYFYLSFLLLALKCGNTVKTETKKETNITDKKEIIEKVKKIEKKEIKIEEKEEILLVLKNPNMLNDAKALITNSGLLWEKLVINDSTFKTVKIKVPKEKTDFWIKRLETANVFSTVVANSTKNLNDIISKKENTFLAVRKDYCSGDCPVFDIVFYKDKTAEFNGIENVPQKGKINFTISQEQFDKLKNLFSKTSFGTYFDTSKTKEVSDYPSTFIIYNNKQIEIKLWKDVAEELAIAYDYLDGILLEKKLIE